MLDLEFTAEQDMLRETVRKVCATYSPLSVVRELEDDPLGYSSDLWKQMAELDLIGLLLPEEHGGSAMSALEGVVLYEEMKVDPWSSRQGRESRKVKVLFPSIACIRTDSISGACGGNEARSARK